MNNIDYVKRGARFEVEVWRDMQKKDVVCTKWHNNVDLENDALVITRPGPFKRTSTGFPDYLAYHKEINKPNSTDSVFGIECKCSGTLDKIEKLKCKWLLENSIFKYILIAERLKVKNKVVIKYTNFVDKYPKYAPSTD